jgi:hypothetical protein
MSVSSPRIYVPEELGPSTGKIVGPKKENVIEWRELSKEKILEPHQLQLGYSDQEILYGSNYE